MNITITREQYDAIRQLKHFAQWYINEHEGASGSAEMIDQWEEDRDEVERGIKTLDEIDAGIREHNATLNLWNT